MSASADDQPCPGTKTLGKNARSLSSVKHAASRAFVSMQKGFGLEAFPVPDVPCQLVTSQSSNARHPVAAPSRTVASKESPAASFWASSASKNVRCSIWFLLVIYCSTVAIASKAYSAGSNRLTASCCQSPGSIRHARPHPAESSRGSGIKRPGILVSRCSAFPKPWLPRSHGMKGRYKAVLHASYSSCASWRTAAAACKHFRPRCSCVKS